VPATAAIPAMSQSTLSERGEPVCYCTHDLLDHSAKDEQPCFRCPCPQMRALPRLERRAR
jgi:hypothetical protein